MASMTSHAYPVYTGTWTNWSRGSVLGARLTLTDDNANLLIAFFAFYITLVTSRLWAIACFVFHRSYSSPNPQDTLHHQRQVFLRTNPEPASGFLSLFELLFAWRGKARRVYRRLLPLITLAVLLAVGFAFATGYSSRVAVDHEVLLIGSGCGIVESQVGRSIEEFDSVLYPSVASEVETAANYAQQCYQPSSFATLSCDTLVQTSLNSTVDLNAPCPFDNSLCRHKDANIELDTGFLDSHEDFGINAPSSERFKYRKVVQCAPLATDGYTSKVNISDDRPYTGYHYGNSTVRDFNYTYGYSNDKVWEQYRANGIIFVESSPDSWYQATVLVNATSRAGTETVPVYIQAEAASPLGCTEQHQICNPNLSQEQGCTPLRGTLDIIDIALALYEDESAQTRLE
ncbi:Uu.00g031190.m01.CDS01 [Anthostomella pinea]|uniref:Uu.00g031190.m01.CDS01 n=1 Tax=Anthostomella pinea TaxID=933095 RepID=A0AAI8YCZ1_9PEZI|nr:Uu.00g031190.m01.CDS01 [Anthostomella pinea]